MTIHRFFASLFLAVVFALLPARTASAQVDIIRGRVVGADTQPVPNVLVTATTLTGNVSRTARTDRSGRYTISFPGGEGDYWVTFSGIGYSPRRYQVKRTADQEILIADARLQPATVTLEAFNVVERAAVSRSDTVSDVSGNEKTVDVTESAVLSPEQLGDLVSMAASIPGVQLIPGADGAADAFSVFGLGGDQNSTQLNGLAFGDASLPRDAQVTTSLATSPYDVSRGGFSGGQLQVRTGSGSNFKSRRLSSNLITPQTQFIDRAGAATGQQYTNLSLGGSASGPIKMDQAFYSGSFQYDRRMQDLQTLLSSSALGLQTAGVSPDSVARLLEILSDKGIPYLASSSVNQYVRNGGSAQGAFNWVQPNSSRGNTYSLNLNGNFSRTQPVSSAFGNNGFGNFGGGFQGASLSTPSRYGTTTNWGGTAQLRHSGLVGFGGIFTETNVGFSRSSQQGNPYMLFPAGSVRVSSQLADGTVNQQTLGFGGAPALNTGNSSQTLAGVNTLSWFSHDNRHRVKLTSELRRDWYTRNVSQNELGTFQYNSLQELALGIPASFTRQLSPRTRDGSQLVGAMSLGDAWRPTTDVQIQYGVRMDGNKYLYGPAENPRVEPIFGQNNTDVPSRLYFSPRVGFSWTYGTDAQVALLPGMVRAPRAVIRGGVGVFQNTPGVELIGGAIDNTGLPTGVQTLTCIGSATPIANWSQYLVDQGAIPSACADGSTGTVFSNNTPNVTVFSPDYAAQRSIRGNLQWSGAILKNRFSMTVDGTMSKNQNQSAGFDLNFPGVQQFTLASEDGRPIFVPASSIVPTTGQIAWRSSRVDTTFGRVTQQRSDLSSDTKQLSVSLRPIAFNSKLFWNVSYVLADVQEQYTGFNSTTGNPLELQRSRGGFSRHQLQLSLGYNFFNTVRVNFGTNIRSGRPYTPNISGDVNGDSYGNDRAFIFDPNDPNTDPAIATGIRNLLANGTKETRECLQAQLGKLAARNSCTSPWSIQNTNLSISLNSLNVGLPQRANLSFNIANPLGGLDRLVNGENLKGWGQNLTPQTTSLLTVRGFDPTTNKFRYEVNERFGSTRVSQTTNRSPMTITAVLRLDIGPSRERQQLLQQLDRGRSRPGNRPNVQQLRGTANVGLLNPMQQILANADTLKLSRKQADSLVAMNRTYVLKSDSIWAPVARELAALPEKYDHDLAYDRYRDARIQTIDMLIRYAPYIRGLLTAEQYRILPTTLAGFLDKRTLQGIRAGTQGQGR